jgi:signal transduction histidine kinase
MPPKNNILKKSKSSRTRPAIILFVTGLFLLDFFYIWLHLTGPFDGNRLGPDEPFGELVWRDNGIIATPLKDGPDGLKKGDLILAVDGVPVSKLAEALFSTRRLLPEWQEGQMVRYTVQRDGQDQEVSVVLEKYPLGDILSKATTMPLVMLIFHLVTSFLFIRRPNEPAIRPLFMVSSAFLSVTLVFTFGLQINDLADPLRFWLFKATTFGATLVGGLGAARFGLTFPKPNPLLRKHRLASWLLCLVPVTAYLILLVTALAFTNNTLAWIGWWVTTWPYIVFSYIFLMVMTLFSNYRLTEPNNIARQQARLIVFAFGLCAAFGFVLGLIPKILTGHLLIDISYLAFIPSIFVGAILVAILRFHLFDFEVILNRTLVYTGLTIMVAGLYILIVGSFGLLFQASGNPLISFLATALVALLFQPLRSHLQAVINQLMFGERDNPYAVISRLGQRLEAAFAPEAIFPSIVETVSQALKIPYVEISLKQNGEFKTAAAYDIPGEIAVQLPLLYQNEVIGQLNLAARRKGEVFSLADRRLFAELARQAGIAAHTVRLTADLQLERERLVTAREEERRRLRRDLHDGHGPLLAALTLKVGTARYLLDNDPQKARLLLLELENGLKTALADIRRLVYDLRPPALDELGLVGALRESANQYNLLKIPENGLTDQSHNGTFQVEVLAPSKVPPLPAAVEVAAYRIVQEALTNVVRHARATNCTVRLAVDDHLEVEISDNGQGLPEKRRAGVGLASMRERAQELGGTCLVEPRSEGGTRILARLPLPQSN